MKLRCRNNSGSFDSRHTKVLILVALVGCFGLDASAQDHILMLQKKNRNRNAYYSPGDELTFYRKGHREKVRSEILSISDSTLFFPGIAVPLREITALHIDEKTKWWIRFKAAQILLIAGSGYIAIDAINQKEFDRQTLLIGGSMIVAGVICKILIPNKLRLKRNVKLRIIRK